MRTAHRGAPQSNLTCEATSSQAHFNGQKEASALPSKNQALYKHVMNEELAGRLTLYSEEALSMQFANVSPFPYTNLSNFTELGPYDSCLASMLQRVEEITII